MKRAFSELHDRRFDVIVIGGGINGSSAAQNLAAGGYNCLVVDKGDFGSGASGRSARMLHPGLRYFEARNPLFHFGAHPGRFIDALRGARQAMQSVSEHLKDAGDRVWPYRMCFPIYKGDVFKSWHVSAGIKLLELLGDGTVPFDFEMVDRDYSAKIPFFEDFRDGHSLEAIACYNEFKFDWPERFCVDMALDAERNGATLVNYCTARLGRQSAAGDWTVTLTSSSVPALAPAEVQAPVVLNMAGTWIDDVLPPNQHKGRLIQATKGIHIVVEMPDTYQGFGVASLNSVGEPYYVLPLHKNFYSIGVTETLFEGDATDISASDEEIDFLINETNALIPGRQLRRADVLRSWAGVRPLTFSKSHPKGSRARALHDLTERGLSGVFALTGGPIMTHRSAGRLALDAVASKLEPSGRAGRVDTSPFAFSNSDNSPPFLADEPDVRVADIEFGVTGEHAQSLIDVLLRRTGLAWRRELTRREVEQAAQIVGPHLNWSTEETSAQIADYMAFQENVFRRPGP
ncbi:MAG: FAD-dependent oxidoreductase [Alphaproteobacteria bacterium]|nr:FAD-dependent oxidoreductase [Alphaproteobacteria bacterium]